MDPGNMGELTSSVPLAELAREVREKPQRVMHALEREAGAGVTRDT